MRQQLRECCDEAEAKRGLHRQALAVEPGLVPVRRGVLHHWQGRQRALARAATTLGARFTVVAVRVVSRGGAIPGAWTILPANQPQAWRCEGRRMWRQRRPAMPRPWTVIVLADRGLSADWLLRRMVRLGWQPCVRLHRGGTLRPDPQATDRPLTSCVPRPGTRWRGTGTACKSLQRQLRCTLLACWEEGSTDPWRILTDLPPDASEAGWDGLRAWIEQQCKCITRAGGPWPRTRLTKPARAARLWLAVAVATRWLLSVGGVAEEAIPASPRLDVTAALGHERRQRRATRRRVVRLLRRGWITIVVAWLRQAPLPLGALLPEPWPRVSTRAANPMSPNPEVRHDRAA